MLPSMTGGADDLFAPELSTPIITLCTIFRSNCIFASASLCPGSWRRRTGQHTNPQGWADGHFCAAAGRDPSTGGRPPGRGSSGFHSRSQNFPCSQQTCWKKRALGLLLCSANMSCRQLLMSWPWSSIAPLPPPPEQDFLNSAPASVSGTS